MIVTRSPRNGYAIHVSANPPEAMRPATPARSSGPRVWNEKAAIRPVAGALHFIYSFLLLGGGAAGEAMTIGSTILMARGTRATTRNRRVWPHTHFEAHIEEECERAAETRMPFAIIRLAVDGNLPPSAIANTMRPRCAPRTCWRSTAGGLRDLPARDVARYGLGHQQGFVGRLRAQNIVARTGMASHPRDGQTPEALVACASERLRGHDTPPPVAGVIVEDPRMRRAYQLAQSAAGASSACWSSARRASART